MQLKPGAEILSLGQAISAKDIGVRSFMLAKLNARRRFFIILTWYHVRMFTGPSYVYLQCNCIVLRAFSPPGFGTLNTSVECTAVQIGVHRCNMPAHLYSTLHQVLFRPVLREEHQVWKVLIVLQNVQQERMALPPQIFYMLYFATPH